MTTPVVIFDLDGTLFDTRHRLHFIEQRKPDWSSFHAACIDDTTHDHAEWLYRMITASGVPVIVCTGRPARYSSETDHALSKHMIFPRRVMMRADGDERTDAAVKCDMLKAIRAEGYHVLFAVEDRTQVVRMWRREGVPVFQVEDTTIPVVGDTR